MDQEGDVTTQHMQSSEDQRAPSQCLKSLESREYICFGSVSPNSGLDMTGETFTIIPFIQHRKILSWRIQEPFPGDSSVVLYLFSLPNYDEQHIDCAVPH